jgi:hypothetical protein
VLRCEECGVVSEEARDWIALLVEDDEEEPDVPASVAMYCPVCADREFGKQRRFRA